MAASKDIFCACSTPPGIGGIAVIRVSGEGTGELLNDCIKVLRTCEGLSPNMKFSEMPGYTSAFSAFTDPSDGHEIDRVVVTRFTGPHSYTGDEMAEISCHGGTEVKNQILSVLVEKGARTAEPGEFTKTAFLNGKIDLSEAEAVMDVISSDSEKALKASNSLMRGSLYRELTACEETIYRALALIEMVVEFPEHDDTPENTEGLLRLMKEAYGRLADIRDSYSQGRMLAERLKAVIAGRPNSGKSSLFNRLAGSSKAIVTSVPGTTRDALELQINIDGIPVTLTDTAGIRATDDIVEAIGVERAIDASTDADVVFYLVDPEITSDDFKDEFKSFISQVKTLENIYVVFSKSDIGINPASEEMKEFLLRENIVRTFSISSESGEGIDRIKAAIRDFYIEAGGGKESQIILLNRRHFERTSEALDSLKLAIDAVETGMGVDVASSVMRTTLEKIGEITGKTVSSELADTIFARFCIGK